MTRQEQAEFILALTGVITTELIIKLGETPDTIDWDAHELRVLLKDKFLTAAAVSTIQKHPSSQRARDYRNIVTTTNL